MKKREKLNYYISSFLDGNMTADQFENLFSQAYDLDESEFIEGSESILPNVRKLLERYSPFDEDLVRSNYFINAETLKTALKEITEGGASK